MRYYKIPVFIKFLIELAAAVPVHTIHGSTVIALYNVHAIFKWFTVIQNEKLSHNGQIPENLPKRAYTTK